MKLVLFFLSSIVLQAQWLNHPTGGVPRRPDGSPNLSAPGPKTAQGKTDFSGMWLAERNKPCPVGGCTDMEVGQEFTDIGWELKGALPLLPWAAELKKSRTAANGVDDPGSHCRPTGLVKMHTSPFYRKIVQTPDLMLILTERDAEHRQIFLDGRALPIDPQPASLGYSVGKWEGDTLVVNSIGFSDGTWLDRNGSPLTSTAKITERFRRVNFGQLDISITVDDSNAYREPWTITLHQHIAVDTELLNYYCMENEKDSGHLVGK